MSRNDDTRVVEILTIMWKKRLLVRRVALQASRPLFGGSVVDVLRQVLQPKSPKRY